MKKRKITVGTLAELAKRMPVLSEEVQRSFIGGGDGTQTNPFTESEFDKFLSSGHFPGGYVLFNGDTSGTYISASCGTSGVVVTNKEIKDGEFVLMSKFAEENIDATGNMIKKLLRQLREFYVILQEV